LLAGFLLYIMLPAFKKNLIMAIQDSRGRIRGRIHNIVYRVVGGENILQGRPRNVKQTAATKASGLEFGLASSAACVIRQAFSPVYQWYDGGMINRCTQAVLKSIRGSRSKPRGERDLHDGDAGCLEGFQFNAASPLGEVLAVRPRVSKDEAGKLSISLPSFKEYGDVKGPKDPSLFKLRLLVIAFNFKEGCYEYLRYEELEFGRSAVIEARTWEVDTSSVPGNLVLVSMSLDFYGRDSLTGDSSMNSKECSPAEIIGAFHIHETVNIRKEEIREAAGEPSPVKKRMNNYHGPEIFRKMAKVRELYSKPDNPKPQVMKVKGSHLLPGRPPS
jgi:hypothetical protein